MKRNDNESGAENKKSPRICVVGAGTRFLSGMSYYTMRLANALATRHSISMILMRQLIPARFYPGAARVGAHLTRQRYAPSVQVMDGVDWYWIPSMIRALAFLVRVRPDIILFEWWTGAVLHTYLILAITAKLLGIQILIELNEVLDTGEAKVPFVRQYVGLVAPFLMRLASGFVVYSEQERSELENAYSFATRPVKVIKMGPFDQYQLECLDAKRREAPVSCCNLLFFGTIRPYKGLEDLIAAFDSIPENEISNYWLTVVGETWEGWTLPIDRIAKSRYRDRITFVNRYVSDDEVGAFFAGADVVVLPYNRASAPGPTDVAMNWGLPLVTTHVGGIPEAVAGYEGLILVPPHDPEAIRSGIIKAMSLRGRRFAHPHSWDAIVSHYDEFFAEILDRGRGTKREIQPALVSQQVSHQTDLSQTLEEE